MRLTALLLLIVAILLLTAPAASFAQNTSPSKLVSPFTGDNGAILRADGTGTGSVADARDLRKFDTGDSHVSCLTLRTYVVARDSRNSDTTHAVGYHECVPAWKFDMRTTELKQRDQEPEPEKR